MYVQKDKTGRIVAVFSNSQPGIAQEWIEGAQAEKPAPSYEDIERLRLLAYANPVTGSDRFKAEADAERLSGNEEAAAIAEQKLLARREEIKSQYPWPESK